MKKAVFYFIIIISFHFVSCEKDFPEIVDYQVEQLQIISVTPSGSILFNASDSLVTVKLEFSQASNVGQVGFDMISSENKKLNDKLVILYDNGLPEFGDVTAGDNKYSNKFPLSSLYPVGTYSIRFYKSDALTGLRQIAQSTFNYDNGQNNIAPVISNLIMPETVAPGGTIIFSVDVTDGNGLNDISSVFYEAYNPDGVKVVNSQGISEFPLFDDGNTSSNGDVTAGDGKYTVLLTFPGNVQIGVWRFEFQARDRGGLLSNRIIKTILVQ